MAIITISRGTHSGGKAVAEQLADKLGHPLLSREQVLLQAAKDYDLSEKELADSLNQPPSYWQQVLGKRLAYVKCVTAVLLEHARQGNLVYHGHVGHLLLSGISHVLRVRVIADLEKRIQSVMTQAHLEREAALAHIQRVDKERSKWAQVLYGVNWDDPGQYDVIVNLERISPATAAESIARLAQTEDFKPTATSLQQFEDFSLGCRVWAAMGKNPATRSPSLEVTAHAGEVTISGNVGSTKLVDVITQTAQQVEGVKTVRSEVGIGTDWHW